MFKIFSRRLARSHNQKGFTLVELMVVVIILGILAALVLPQFTQMADRAKEGRAIAEMRGIKNALDMRFQDRNTFPTTGEIAGGHLATFGLSSLGLDPWGTTYEYIRGAVAGPGNRSTTFDLISAGPDQDLTITADNLIARHNENPRRVAPRN